MNKIDDLLKQPGAWLRVKNGPEIIVSSRIRLARNLENHLFPAWADDEESSLLWQQMRGVLLPALQDAKALVCEMKALPRVERDVLLERHLISKEFSLARSPARGLIAKGDETVAIMVNEEDHLRLQGLSPGLALKELWQNINLLDSKIEKKVNYAFSPQLGYLTACPTNVGTGMRASVMMHLPGLVLIDEMAKIIKGVDKIGLAVRGLWGEGTDAAGNMFQISNQTTLGEKEDALIQRIEDIVFEIVEHEENARARLLQKQEHVLRDHIGRAYGILRHAHLLNSHEALDLLSTLRLGIDLGIMVNWSAVVLDELFLLTQPGHLQKLEGRQMSSEKRDLARARLVRERLALKQ